MSTSDQDYRNEWAFVAPITLCALLCGVIIFMALWGYHHKRRLKKYQTFINNQTLIGAPPNLTVNDPRQPEHTINVNSPIEISEPASRIGSTETTTSLTAANDPGVDINQTAVNLPGTSDDNTVNQTPENESSKNMSWSNTGTMGEWKNTGNMGPVHNTGNMGPVNVGNNAGLHVNGPGAGNESSPGDNSQGQSGLSGVSGNYINIPENFNMSHLYNNNIIGGMPTSSGNKLQSHLYNNNINSGMPTSSDSKSSNGQHSLPKTYQKSVLVQQVELQQNVNDEESAIFDKLSIIGQGSFGKVLQVRMKNDNEIRAVKCIPIYGLDDKNKVYREVESLKKVNSAYIAKYYDWWIGEKTFYIIMEYCPDNLRKILNLRPDLFARQYGKTMNDLEYYMSCEIFRQTLECVQYMHELRPPVIHRDLKPENILISYDSEHDRFVKLCDFGLAAVHHKTINNQGSNKHTIDVGTVGYQAPEIANGARYDHKSDVYSLAVIGAEIFELDLNKLEKTGNGQDENETQSTMMKNLQVTLSSMLKVGDKGKKRPECSEVLAKYDDWGINKAIIGQSVQIIALINKLKDQDEYRFFYEFFKRCNLMDKYQAKIVTDEPVISNE